MISVSFLDWKILSLACILPRAVYNDTTYEFPLFYEGLVIQELARHLRRSGLEPAFVKNSHRLFTRTGSQPQGARFVHPDAGATGMRAESNLKSRKSMSAKSLKKESIDPNNQRRRRALTTEILPSFRGREWWKGVPPLDFGRRGRRDRSGIFDLVSRNDPSV
jgi:hypothetical protein